MRRQSTSAFLLTFGVVALFVASSPDVATDAFAAPKASGIVRLRGRTPRAKGMNKLVFDHPTRPGWIIAIRRAPDSPDPTRDVAMYEQLRRHHLPVPQAGVEPVLTDKGVEMGLTMPLVAGIYA